MKQLPGKETLLRLMLRSYLSVAPFFGMNESSSHGRSCFPSPGQRRPRKSRFNYKPRLLMEGRASGYRESPAWRKGYFLLPYHQEQILAIYLEEELLMKLKQSQLLVRQFAPHLKKKSSGILLYYDTEPLGNSTTFRLELGLLFCCAWAWVDCFPYLYSVHFLV